MEINELNFNKLDGLIPAIVIDNESRQVLMLGFMNSEALQKTIASKKVTFYSRTKKRLWTKGETSGNFLNLIKILPDCDQDSLLIYAEPKGSTCHNGIYSCFGIDNKRNLDFLAQLFDYIPEKEITRGILYDKTV